MILLETFKTKSVATIAIYDSLVRGIRPINNFVATFPRTPLEESALVRKLLRMPLDIFCPVVYPIFFALFIIEVGNEEAMGYGYVAIVLLTFEKNTLWVILNLYFHVILPADFVVLVAANQSFCLIVFVIILKITVASLTRILVNGCCRVTYVWKLFRQPFIKFKSYLVFEFILILKPLFFNFGLIPIKIAQNRDQFILIL